MKKEPNIVSDDIVIEVGNQLDDFINKSKYDLSTMMTCFCAYLALRLGEHTTEKQKEVLENLNQNANAIRMRLKELEDEENI